MEGRVDGMSRHYLPCFQAVRYSFRRAVKKGKYKSRPNRIPDFIGKIKACTGVECGVSLQWAKRLVISCL